MRFRLGPAAVSIVLVCCGGKVSSNGPRDTGPTTPPGSCAADLENDARNCGWCGHDCRGGTCKNSVCAPQPIASREESPTLLSIDDGAVYWSAPASIRSARKEGGAARELVATKGVRGLALDATNLYWVEPEVGPSNTFSVSKAGGSIVVRAAVEAADVAVCGRDLLTGTIEQLVVREHLDTRVVDRWPVNAIPRRIACFGPNVVWVDQGAGMGGDGTAGRVATLGSSPGAEPNLLVTDVRFPQRLFVANDGVVYFTSGRFSGLVQSVSLAGGAVTVLADGQLDPQGVAVDDAYVYWVTVGQLPTEGTVKRVAKKGGAPEFLAFGERRPLAIAVDEAWVYWTAQGDAGKANGGVYRVAK